MSEAPSEGMAALESVARVVKEVIEVAQKWPQGVPQTIRIECQAGEAVLSVTVTPSAPATPLPPTRPAPLLHRRLTQIERYILTAARDSRGALSGPKLLEAAGYPDTGRYRSILGELRHRKLLDGTLGSHGYPITAAGQQALDEAEAADEVEAMSLDDLPPPSGSITT